MSNSAPNPQALSMALSMIDQTSWRLPAQVINLVRACTVDTADQGRYPAHLSYSYVSEWLYGDRDHNRNVARVLTRLVSDRILLVEVEAAGRRAAGYRLNGAFHQWRNVPWRLNRELILRRLGAFVAPYGAPQTPDSGAFHGAPQNNFVAPSMERHNSELVALSRGRHKQSTSGAPWKAPQSRPPLHSIELLRDSVSLESEESEGFKKVAAEICALTECQKLFGAPAEIVRRIVDDAGGDPEPVLAILRRSPGGLGIKRLPEWLELEWKRTNPDPAERMALLKKRHASLLRMAPSWENEPEGDEYAEEKRAELADVERQLQAAEAL